MAAVKTVSAQVAFVLIAFLAIAPFASAKTSSQRKHTTAKKTASTSKTQHSSTHKTSSKSSHSRKRHVSRKSWKAKGQHKISSDRTKEIQQALIRQHYLDGDANGVWDTRTQEACRKYQADNGWQTKVLPDSRALIKLGLGPDRSDVLNPETAAKSPYLPGGGTEKASEAAVPTTVTER